jgi:lipid II:glycine glycyltransferase (peptidoglycan interpeptide bridge formation enzyme)
MKDMRKTTRYSIRKAEKEGVIIEKNADLNRFWKIYSITSERENFTPFSREFIQAEYEEFNRTGNALFLSGLLPGSHECAASALIVFTKSCAFYHQGATTHSKIPVSYLLQWRAIEEAKKRGCSFYNFWGTHLPGRTPKNWGGLSLFKQGFGGWEKDYVSTQDYVLNPVRYALSFLFEQYLKFRRGI